MVTGCAFSRWIAAMRCFLRRSTSSAANAGRRITSANRSSDGSRFSASADIDTVLMSSWASVASVAPRRASSSLISIAERRLVPSSSMSMARLAAPARLVRSEV